MESWELDPSEEELVSHLTCLRSAMGLEVDDLAQRTGIEPDRLAAVESREAELTVELLFELARGLGMTVETILRLWRGARIEPRTPAA